MITPELVEKEAQRLAGLSAADGAMAAQISENALGAGGWNNAIPIGTGQDTSDGFATGSVPPFRYGVPITSPVRLPD